MKLVNELVDLMYLLPRLFLVLDGWQDLANFIVIFLWITLSFLWDYFRRQSSFEFADDNI